MLGLSPAQVTAQAADADYFQYVLACQAMMRNSGIQWTGWKDLMRDGGTPPPAGAPVAPTLPAAVPAVEPGIEVRFRNLVKQIKPHTNYNEAIGEALGIEGPQQTGPDLTTVQPDIKATINGNRVEIGWVGTATARSSTCARSKWIATTIRAQSYSPTILRPTTWTPRLSPRLRPNGLTAPSTAWATNASANGANQSA